MSDIQHHIRILGGSALHVAGTILGVTRNHHHAANSDHIVHHDHAHDLVAKGHAEWIHAVPTAAPMCETHEQVVERHGEEHAALLAKHIAEHREVIERHAAEHKAAVAAVGITGLAATGGI